MTPLAIREAAKAAIDGKTKPVGSLGRIEALAVQIAAARRSLRPRMERCSLLIFAGDHGISAEGVSAYPQAVTRQMVSNFLAGGAAANAFAGALGVPVRVVDAGVAGEPIAHPDLVVRRLGPGTRSFARQPAMEEAQVGQALDHGRALGAAADADAVCLGEMGIANTSAAALIAHKLTGRPLDLLIGRGTGVDGDALEHKRSVLARAATRTPNQLSPRDSLREYGGFEIAMMAGAMLGAADAGKVVIVDGFIASAAAAAALELEPAIRNHLVFAHRSAELGHGTLLDHLGVAPLLDLHMRLGEGTGALLAWPLVKAAAAMLNDMATFEDAGVSGPA